MMSSSLLAASNTAFINDIPDFTQSQIRGWRHHNGSQYCGPVAVSNSLYWMSAMNGNQADLVKALASRRYMNTDVTRGTSTANLLNGVHAIAIDLFGGYDSLAYQGWKFHPAKYSTGVDIPDFSWITEGIANDSTVWLNVGWYRYDRNTDVYYRLDGHWVTLVGYDDDILILHDPAPRAGLKFANEYVHTSSIRSGVLAGSVAGLPRSASGYLLLGEGMHIKSIADVAIIDGAVKFKR